MEHDDPSLWRRAVGVTTLGATILTVPIVGHDPYAQLMLDETPAGMFMVVIIAAFLAAFVAHRARASWRRLFYLAPLGGFVLAVTAGSIVGGLEPAAIGFCLLFGAFVGPLSGLLCALLLWPPLRAASRAVSERRLAGPAHAGIVSASWLAAVSIVSALLAPACDTYHMGHVLCGVGLVVAVVVATLANDERARSRAFVERVRSGREAGLRIDPTGRYLERAGEGLDYRGHAHAWEQVVRV